MQFAGGMAATVSWVTMMTVCPCPSTRLRSRSRTSWPLAESSMPVGSSANTTSGRVTSARAMATRCCCPPDSWDGRWPARSARPTEPSTRLISGREGRCPASRSGSATFSSAVSEGSRLNDWNTNPIRFRRSTVSLVSLRSPSSCPPSQTSPEVGRSSPAAHCRSVLLPEPDGPMTAVNVPATKPSVTWSSAVTTQPDRYTLLTRRSATACSAAASRLSGNAELNEWRMVPSLDGIGLLGGTGGPWRTRPAGTWGACHLMNDATDRARRPECGSPPSPPGG